MLDCFTLRAFQPSSFPPSQRVLCVCRSRSTAPGRQPRLGAVPRHSRGRGGAFTPACSLSPHPALAHFWARRWNCEKRNSKLRPAPRLPVSPQLPCSPAPLLLRFPVLGSRHSALDARRSVLRFPGSPSSSLTVPSSQESVIANCAYNAASPNVHTPSWLTQFDLKPGNHLGTDTDAPLD